MRIVMIGLLAILVLLGLSAGAAKVMATPAEVQFFASAGLSEAWLLPFGLVQIAGAILAAIPKGRPFGLILTALGFFASSIVIFMTGNLAFGLISLIPVVLALVVRAKI